MSDMMMWYEYYMKMTSEPNITIDQQVSYYKAAQSILNRIRKEADHD